VQALGETAPKSGHSKTSKLVFVGGKYKLKIYFTPRSVFSAMHVLQVCFLVQTVVGCCLWTGQKGG